MTVQHLRLASIIYLLVPSIIFFGFWTSGIITVIGLLCCAYILFNEWRDRQFAAGNAFSRKDLVVLTVFALVLTCVSGITGLCYQTFDHWCHNVKFYELFKYEWPIRIPSDGPVIAYYYGYYVVPALYSKFVGHISEGAIFLWTFVGFLLGVSWLYLVLHKKAIFVFLALTIGDLPHVIKSAFYKFFGPMYEFGDFGVESWSNFENLLWVPNQVIPTLIIGGMFVYCLREKISIERIVLPVALTFWWAVFPAFTSGLLIGILVIFKWIEARGKIEIRSFINDIVVPCLCCLPVLILYLSHEKAPISGFIWQFPDRMDSRVAEYLINIGINILVFYLVYRLLANRGNGVLPGAPLYLILFFIMLFPIYRIGKVNDFLFRGLMPYLLIVGLYLYERLSAARFSELWNKVRRAPLLLILAFLLTASSLIAIGRVGRAFYVNRLGQELMPDRVQFEPIPYDAYANIYEVLKDKWSQMEADQYLGKEDSIYEKFIAPASPSTTN